MSIIPTLTPAQKLVQGFQLQILQRYSVLSTDIRIWFAKIWTNPDQVNLSPPQAWAALGTNAVQVRTLFQAINSILAAANSAYVAPEEPSKYTVTENNDGSITCVLNS